MRALLKKEFMLCLHPTSLIFLAFAAFVFIPNYPYEVMFFFSGLSVFFICLTARENGDSAFSCTLPASRTAIVSARMLFCGIFQVLLLLAAGIFTAVKSTVFPMEAQFNMAGSAANPAFLGYGLLLMGTFNLIFFPLYFRNPNKVGVPLILAGAVQFLAIALLVVFRFAVPLFSDVLSTPDPVHIGAQTTVFALGLFLYAGMSALSVFLSAKRFARVDL